MEPRQSWYRHRAIAEEFCIYDEQVRIAETVLAEAQAYRRRVLAAFAITVGRDRSVADLLGLAEREVRAARRTVGKSGARTVARELLHNFPPGESDNQPYNQHTPAPDTPVPEDATTSPSPLDAALAEGWRAGIDLHVLAAETGVEVSTVVARLKKLSTQGLLPDLGTTASPRGRHRRAPRGGEQPADPRVPPPRTDPVAADTTTATPAPAHHHGSAPPDPWDTWETEFSARHGTDHPREPITLRAVDQPDGNAAFLRPAPAGYS